MKWVSSIVFLVLMVGCKSDDVGGVDVPEGERLGPISEDVPVVANLWSISFPRSQVVNLRVSAGVADFFVGYEPMAGGWPEIEGLIKAAGEKRFVLRIWANPKTPFKTIKEQVREAVKLGIAHVEVKVKDVEERFGSLVVDIPVTGDSYGVGMPFFLKATKTGLFWRSESGELEPLQGLDALSRRSAIIEAAGQLAGAGDGVWQIAIDDDVSHQFVCEVLSRVRGHRMRVYLVDLP